MTHVRRCGFLAAFLATGLAVAFGTAVRAQDDLGGAKTLYVNASYEEALTVLEKQIAAAGTTGVKAAEVHHYRALCFIALGRTTEADQAIAASVSADPFTVPDTSELSPRVVSVFNAARARLIPDVARATLADGRQLMQKGDAAGANRRFEAVTKLLSEPGLAGRADLNDLTMAATAFSELTKAQMAAAATAAAAAAAAAPPPPQPEAPTVTAASSAVAPAGAPATTPTSPASTPAAGRTASGAQPPPVARPAAGTTLRPPAAVVPPGFVPAAAISQPVPAWQPAPGMMSQLNFTGAVRVSIDAEGKVTGAVMDPSVYPPYDRLVLNAARGWTYRPATQDGKPVASERRVEIVLKPR